MVGRSCGVRRVNISSVLAAQVQEALRLQTPGLGVLGFVDDDAYEAYALHLFRGSLSEQGIGIPYGISAFAVTEPLDGALKLTLEGDEVKFVDPDRPAEEIEVLAGEDRGDFRSVACAFRVQMAIQVPIQAGKAVVSISDRLLQSLRWSPNDNSAKALFLPETDRVFDSSQEISAGELAQLKAVVAEEEDSWIPVVNQTTSAASRSKKKSGKKKGARTRTAADPPKEAVIEEKPAALYEPAPDGYPVQLVPIGGGGSAESETEFSLLVESVNLKSSANARLAFDTIFYTHKKTALLSVLDAAVRSLEEQAQLYAKAFLDMGSNSSEKLTKGKQLPCPVHFLPPGIPFYTTLLIPRDIQEVSVAEVAKRRQNHESLFLPTDRPLFRLSCEAKIEPPTSGENDMLEKDGRIICPHRGLADPALPHGKLYMADGNYTYYHYMQDKFNDNGWGCAYRSLQTIVSWCRHQKYTDAKVPSHKEVQTMLVDMGDKPRSFIGSKEWIGANEVCYVLEKHCEVSSRILFMSSGAEFEEKGRELARHFEKEGSPIMIGGGVLAYTLIGVCFDDVTGETRFLILDPHYTGGEDLKLIQSKGWIGWKKSDLFLKNAFYNLCMPVRPKLV